MQQKLNKYIEHRPECFYSEDIFHKFLYWLNKRDNNSRGPLQEYFKEFSTELNQAFHHLNEVNRYDWHDGVLKLDEYEKIRFIDQKIHPAYLRLVEAVLAPFLHVVAHFYRFDRGKGTQGLDLYNIMDNVKKTEISDAAAPYLHKVRNGIGHGKITYLQNEILYKDRKGNSEKYNDSEIIRTFDNLLDTCNSIALALWIFFLSKQSDCYALPRQLLLEELRQETKTPWWEVVGCIPSEKSRQHQLNVYVKNKTRDYDKVRYSAFQTGLLAELFSSGYERYFISILSDYSLPGWAAFNGDKLKELRLHENTRFEDYKCVLENNDVYFYPRVKAPKLFHHLNSSSCVTRKSQ